MSVSFEMTENGRIYVITFTDPWSVAEVTDHYPQIKDYLDSATGKVQFLFDFTQAGMWHGNVFRARHAPFTGHPKMGYLAIISTSLLFERVADTLIRLGRTDYTRFFKTKAEGLAFLYEQLSEIRPMQ